MSSKSTLGWVSVAVVALFALRWIHIEADAPEGLTWNVGVYVDEGYKTLDARNLAQFGAPHWNAGDDYVGWGERSPLTHWPYYLSFRWLGPSLASARWMTTIWFALLLVAFAASMWRRYPPPLVLLGLLLLGTQHTLFFFSRAALSEVPLAVCVYLLPFALARNEKLSAARTVTLFAVLLCVATFGIKRSAPGYFIPVGLGLLVATGTGWRAGPQRGVVVRGVLLALLLGFCAWVAFGTEFAGFIRVAEANPLRKMFAGQLMHSSAPVMAVGLACAFHALLVDPARYLRSPYRASLLALLLAGPWLFLVLRYRPLRYFVPLLPAYALIAVEWLHLRTWERPVPARVRPIAGFFFGSVLIWTLLAAGRSVHRYVLQPLFGRWSLPEALPVEWLGLAAALLALPAFWRFRRVLLSGASALIAVVALLTLSTGRDLAVVGGFLAEPPYHSRKIAADLTRLLPPEASIAGDWAPFLTLGTPIRSLYSNPVINHPRRFSQLEPDYFLWSRDDDPVPKLEAVGVCVGPPVYESEYLDRRVVLYPLLDAR